MKKLHLVFHSFLFLFLALNASAQSIDAFPAIVNDTSIISVKGKIVDDKGNAIGFASIRTGKKSSFVFANEKGEFELNLQKKSVLLVGSSGFDDKEVIVENNLLTIQLDLAAEGGDINNSSSQVYNNNDINDRNHASQRDSIYANDIVVQRDVVVPENRNKFFLYPAVLVSGGMLSMGVQLLKEGKYVYQLTDLSGNILFQKEILLEKNARLINLSLPSLAKGKYQFVLVQSETGIKFSERIELQ